MASETRTTVVGFWSKDGGGRGLEMQDRRKIVLTCVTDGA
jgi:hypothetical protein